MAVKTFKNDLTGEQVTFDWKESHNPTPQELDHIFEDHRVKAEAQLNKAAAQKVPGPLDTALADVSDPAKSNLDPLTWAQKGVEHVSDLASKFGRGMAAMHALPVTPEDEYGKAWGYKGGNFAGGLADVAESTLQGAAEVAGPGALARAPIPALAGAAGFTAGSEGVRRGMEALGAPPEYARLGGVAAGIGAGTLGARLATPTPPINPEVLPPIQGGLPPGQAPLPPTGAPPQVGPAPGMTMENGPPQVQPPVMGMTGAPQIPGGQNLLPKPGPFEMPSVPIPSKPAGTASTEAVLNPSLPRLPEGAPGQFTMGQPPKAPVPMGPVSPMGTMSPIPKPPISLGPVSAPPVMPPSSSPGLAPIAPPSPPTQSVATDEGAPPLVPPIGANDMGTLPRTTPSAPLPSAGLSPSIPPVAVPEKLPVVSPPAEGGTGLVGSVPPVPSTVPSSVPPEIDAALTKLQKSGMQRLRRGTPLDRSESEQTTEPSSSQMPDVKAGPSSEPDLSQQLEASIAMKAGKMTPEVKNMMTRELDNRLTEIEARMQELDQSEKGDLSNDQLAELGRLNAEVESVYQRKSKLESQRGSMNFGPLGTDSPSNFRWMNKALYTSSIPEAQQLGKLIPDTQAAKFKFVGQALREGLTNFRAGSPQFDAHVASLFNQMGVAPAAQQGAIQSLKTQFGDNVKQWYPMLVNEAGRELFDKSMASNARNLINSIRDPDSKAFAKAYLDNYMSPGMKGSFSKVIQAGMTQSGRSLLGFSTRLQLLHFSRLFTGVMPNLSTRDLAAGFTQTMAHPVESFKQLGELGIVPSNMKPWGLKTNMEKFDIINALGNIADSFVSSTAFKGKVNELMRNGATAMQAERQAVPFAWDVDARITPATVSKFFAEQKAFGRAALQFKQQPMAMFDQWIHDLNITNPTKAAKTALGIGMAATAHYYGGVTTFHMGSNLIKIGGGFLGQALAFAGYLLSGKWDKAAVQAVKFAVPGSNELENIVKYGQPSALEKPESPRKGGLLGPVGPTKKESLLKPVGR